MPEMWHSSNYAHPRCSRICVFSDLELIKVKLFTGRSSADWLEQGCQLGCQSEPLAQLLPGLLVSAKHLAGQRWRHPSGCCWTPRRPLLASDA